MGVALVPAQRRATWAVCLLGLLGRCTPPWQPQHTLNLRWQSLARQTNGSTCAGITPAATCRAEVPAVALAGKLSLKQIDKEVDQVFNLFDVDGM